MTVSASSLSPSPYSSSSLAADILSESLPPLAHMSRRQFSASFLSFCKASCFLSSPILAPFRDIC
nr:MAG TPA: hypothetical protein [Caudoviricetes sp.]